MICFQREITNLDAYLIANGEASKLIENVALDDASVLRVVDPDAAAIRTDLTQRVVDAEVPITKFVMDYAKNLTKSLPFTDYLTEVRA